MEGLPMFAAAMVCGRVHPHIVTNGVIQLAGNVANLPAKDLNVLAFEYLGARLLYTAVYMVVRSEAASYLRTGVWAWSISIPILALYKAGKRLSPE